MEKIQELTEKLYREGVERGQAEAAKIKAEAEAEAQKILDNAREQAQTIEAQAKKKAAELLSGLIERSPGAPTVVPSSDKRPPFEKCAESDFIDI